MSRRRGAAGAGLEPIPVPPSWPALRAPGRPLLRPAPRAYGRLLGFAGLVLLALPTMWLLKRAHAPAGWAFQRWANRRVCRLLGIEVARRGAVAAGSRVLLVANHTSWLDIPIMSSLAPFWFVARHDVRQWPLIGLIARLQGTIFVERRVSRAADHRDELAARLAAGDNLLLFPEGKAGTGHGVLPFKSAFFAVAAMPGEPPVQVQPVAVRYTHLDGLPLTRGLRPSVAWFGDMTFMPHLWEILNRTGLRVEVTFLPPLDGVGARDRKDLAARSRSAIAEHIGGGPAGGGVPSGASRT